MSGGERIPPILQPIRAQSYGLGYCPGQALSLGETSNDWDPFPGVWKEDIGTGDAEGMGSTGWKTRAMVDPRGPWTEWKCLEGMVVGPQECRNSG